jgi:hypothetical protein
MQRSEGTRGGRSRWKTLVVALVVGAVVLGIVLIASIGGDPGGFY